MGERESWEAARRVDAGQSVYNKMSDVHLNTSFCTCVALHILPFRVQLKNQDSYIKEVFGKVELYLKKLGRSISSPKPLMSMVIMSHFKSTKSIPLETLVNK